MTVRECTDWARQHVNEAVIELDGEAWELAHVIGKSVALRNAAGRMYLASAERVAHAWRAQNGRDWRT